MAAITQFGPIALPTQRRTIEVKTEVAEIVSSELTRVILYGTSKDNMHLYGTSKDNMHIYGG